MIILVTGCIGMIGYNVCMKLLNDTAVKTVIGVDIGKGLRESEFLLRRYQNFKYYKLDIGNYNALKDIFNKYKIDLVYHFAALACEGLSYYSRSEFYHTNTIGTGNIVSLCVENNCRLVYTSSMSVYGDQIPPFHETMDYRPQDPYAISKTASEMDIINAGKYQDLKYTILRLQNVYGPGQNIRDPYRNVITIWIKKYLQGLPITVYGDGSSERSFTYVDDIIPGIIKAGTLGNTIGKIINIGTMKKMTIEETSRMFSIVVNCKVIHIEKRQEVKSAFIDNTLSIHLLGIEYKTSFTAGILKSIKWFRENVNIKDLEQEVFENIECRKDIPSFYT